MAANFWASTQRRHWQYTREELYAVRSKLDESDHSHVQQYPLPDRRLLSIYINRGTITIAPQVEQKTLIILQN